MGTVSPEKLNLNVKKIIKTDRAPLPVGPYSQAIQAGPFLYCSGQVAIDPKSQEFISGSVQAEAELVMKNIEAVLNEAGYSFSDVIKTQIYLTDMKDFQTVNEVYAQYFVQNPPARSTFAVAGLPKGAKVEIEVIAWKNA